MREYECVRESESVSVSVCVCVTEREAKEEPSSVNGYWKI